MSRPAPSPATATGADDNDDPYEPEIPLTRSLIAGGETTADSDSPAGSAIPQVRPVAGPVDLAEAAAHGYTRHDVAAREPESLFLSGVLSFPWRGLNLGRWVAMSGGLVISGEVYQAMTYYMQGGTSVTTLAMPFLSIMFAALALVTSAYCAPCFLAAVEDTADGHDQVQDSLAEIDQWFFSLFSVAWIVAISGALGYPLVLSGELGPGALAVSGILLFPVLLLSAMESDSFLLPVSAPVLSSLTRLWWVWLGFYLLSGALWVGWLWLSSEAIVHAPELTVLVAMPIGAAVLLVYARLIGRLAWRIGRAPTANKKRRIRHWQCPPPEN